MWSMFQCYKNILKYARYVLVFQNILARKEPHIHTTTNLARVVQSQCLGNILASNFLQIQLQNTNMYKNTNTNTYTNTNTNTNTNPHRTGHTPSYSVSVGFACSDYCFALLACYVPIILQQHALAVLCPAYLITALTYCNES